MSQPLVSIFTANSNSGSACIAELVSKYPKARIFSSNSNSGSACIAELVSKYPKVRVRGVFRTEEKAEPFRTSYPNIEIVVGCDADKPSTLDKAFQGAQYALIVTPHDPKRGIDDDARLTKNMIESAVANNVEYIVLVASWTVHFPEQLSLLSSRFKPSEILLEKLGKEKGLKWTVLRGGVFMENTISNVKQAVKTSVYNFPDIFCPYIDTKDIGKCAAACLAAPNKNVHHEKFYEMNGPEQLAGERLAEICSKVFEKKITFQPIAKEEFKKFMPEAVSQVFEFMVDNRNCIPFTSDVKNLTGEWSSYEDFIRNHLNEFF